MSIVYCTEVGLQIFSKYVTMSYWHFEKTQSKEPVGTMHLFWNLQTEPDRQLA